MSYRLNFSKKCPLYSSVNDISLKICISFILGMLGASIFFQQRGRLASIFAYLKTYCYAAFKGETHGFVYKHARTALIFPYPP